MNLRRLATFLIFPSVFFALRTAPGQVPVSEEQRISASLPQQERAVVDRLLSLGELPAGTWKMHAGDLTHAEAVSLDETAWQPVAPMAKAPTDAVWFRQTIAIPDTLNGYDLSGARIWFQFHAAANGPMPEIIYANGRRVAMGEDLEPIVLLDDVRAGDKIVIAIKLLHTIDVKTFRGATLRVEFAENRPNPEDLAQEFLSAWVLLPSLAPGDQGKLDTLNAAIGAVDVASLDSAVAASDGVRTADGVVAPASPPAVVRASSPAPSDVRAQNESRFDASLKAAQAKLEPLRPLLSQATLHLTGNSHIDAAWLWPWTETVDVVRRTFGTALQLMDEYPGYTYTQSAAAYNAWMADKYPAMNAEIKKRIAEGRWEIVGGMWVEPDLNMPDGESLVRQLLVGKRWYKQAYGVDVRIGWNPDSFGYNWQLPQIYKKSGVDYFLTQKMTWNDTNQLPFKLFWWQSPDGSKVLTYFPHGYDDQDLAPLPLGNDLAAARKRAPGMTEMMDLYGVGDHGGGPTRAVLDEGFHWAAPDAASIAADGGPPVTPKFEFGTAQSFFSAIEKQIAPESPVWNYQSIAKGYEAPPEVQGKVSIPTWDSELYFEYHRGVFTTQANHKHNMRVAEEEMLNSEKLSSIAWLYGLKYPADELTEDWKKVLFNQFHDLAAGSGIAVIYKDAQKDYDWVRMSTNVISERAQQSLLAKIDTDAAKGAKDAQTVVVFNPLGWVRNGTALVHMPVEGQPGDSAWVIPEQGDSEKARIISYDKATGQLELEVPVKDVPALGYETIHVSVAASGSSAANAHANTQKMSSRIFTALKYGSQRPQVAAPTGDQVTPPASRAAAAGAITIHDGRLGLVVDGTTGCITSLRVGVLDPNGGEETLAPGACGNQLQFFKDTPKQYDAWNIDPGTLDVPPSTIDKVDSVEETVASDGSSAVRVTYRWQNSKFVQTIRLDGDQVDIDNDVDWHEKHVLLKAAFPLAVTSEFATYEIPYGTIERPTTRNNTWEKAQFEVPAMRWADLSGAGPDRRVHGLSILNQDKYGYDAAGNVLRITLLRSPTWPDPDADQGEHHFHYALYPHAGTWKDALTVRHGWEYDYPLQAVVTTAHSGSLPPEHSFASVSPENVVLTAIKKAEDVDALIFRAYEWAGTETTAEFHVPPGATGATVTNLMEQPEGEPFSVTGDVIKVPIHPYEILTLRVDYAKADNSQ
ncbi:MAG TPA: glycoside hydrolase family 38 C-terminal domain-containing protein [Terracidiphilus sp.]